MNIGTFVGLGFTTIVAGGYLILVLREWIAPWLARKFRP